MRSTCLSDITKYKIIEIEQISDNTFYVGNGISIYSIAVENDFMEVKYRYRSSVYRILFRKEQL